MLKINSKAPSFIVPSTTNNKYSLKDSAGKYVVLYFYPKDDTPGCSMETNDFTAKADLTPPAQNKTNSFFWSICPF